MQLFIGSVTQRLHDCGHSVRDLTVCLWTVYGLNISYLTVAAYCRASDRSYGKPEVWNAIMECLKEWEGKKNE